LRKRIQNVGNYQQRLPKSGPLPAFKGTKSMNMSPNSNHGDGDIQASLKKPKCDDNGRPEVGGFREKGKSNRGGEVWDAYQIVGRESQRSEAGVDIITIDLQMCILGPRTMTIKSMTLDLIVARRRSGGKDMLLVLYSVTMIYHRQFYNVGDRLEIRKQSFYYSPQSSTLGKFEEKNQDE
jgi:hypothetical protein